MINQQLLDYIRQQMGRGVAKDAIRQALISSGGWIASDVDVALAAADKSPDIGAPVIGPAGSPTKYAGFWIRFIALMVDAMAISVPTTIIKAVMFMGSKPAIVDVSRGAFASSPQTASALAVSTLLSLAIGLSYFIFFTYYKGATPGKMLVGIQVRNQDLTRMSFGKVVLRETVGRILSQLILCIGYIMAAFTAKKRGLHDMISGSVVVYKDPSKRHIGRIILAACIGLIIPGLVMVAIVGILSSVVLVSLGSARGRAADPNAQFAAGRALVSLMGGSDQIAKADDARAMSDVMQLRTAVESKFDGFKYPVANDCFSGAMAAEPFASLVADIVKQGRVPSCDVQEKAYAISVKLSSSTREFCIDSTGASGYKGMNLSDLAAPRCAPSPAFTP